MRIFVSHRDKALELFYQGKLAVQQENLDRATFCFTAASKIDPDLFLGFFGQGVVYLKKGEYDCAIAYFTKALHIASEDAVTYYFRSLSYKGKGDDEQQRIDYERALALTPELDHYITAIWDPSLCDENVMDR